MLHVNKNVLRFDLISTMLLPVLIINQLLFVRIIIHMWQYLSTLNIKVHPPLHPPPTPLLLHYLFGISVVCEIVWYCPQITNTLLGFFPQLFFFLCFSLYSFYYVPRIHCYYAVSSLFLRPSSGFFTQIILFFNLSSIL